ncbi:MAG: hypothetical protein R3301_00705 [Saprospiraceae bacterium]|nr:hypothetical protein [Saprospiraceae bacterium]
MKERRRRGWLLIIMGVIMLMTHFLQLDRVFILGGVLFVALGCAELFGNNRYRRKYRSK